VANGFPEEEVQQVLENLRYRFPHATEADALTILEDGERACRSEQEYEAADAANVQRGFDEMGAQ
jgi:hypothetical protein